MKHETKEWLKRQLRKVFKVTKLERIYFHPDGSLRRDVEVESGRRMVDVCFINGCDPRIVPHPSRYRVTHQREQLEANNISTDQIFFEDLTEDDVRYANAFVIFRCPYTEKVGALIEAAKKMHKPVYYDIDDLVFDTVYTDLIPYVQGLDETEYNNYSNFVKRMGRTLSMCDGAITTTAALRDEMQKYVPEVLLNRNSASDELYGFSDKALQEKTPHEGEIRMGYFSGSISHNADVELILPDLVKLLSKHENLYFYLVGEIDLPEELKAFESRVRFLPFMDWRDLPKNISEMDINLAPLRDDIFNRAKSENKWVEASLVKTVTVASDVGAFKEMVENKETGFLCKDDEWFDTIEYLIEHPEERERVADNAYAFVKEHCLTMYNGKPLADFFRSKLSNTVALLLPSTGISGGILVALRHIRLLYDRGCNVTILADAPEANLPYMECAGVSFPVVKWHKDTIDAYFDKAIATFWSTTEFLEHHGRIREKFYLVQGFETNLYPINLSLRPLANRTYSLGDDIEYVTISGWCRDWLKEKFQKEAAYAPNGIDLSNFNYKKREFSPDKKVRILIEGDSFYAYKGVDESFKIVEKLDPAKYEVWYLSYSGEAKDWYRVDKFFHKVPYSEVGRIYEDCDILVKSSYLESFSYPPLEMMATGGFVVCVQNDGNKEYIRHDYNALVYDKDDIDAGAAAVESIVNDSSLRERLEAHFTETVTSRSWEKIGDEICRLYHL